MAPLSKIQGLTYHSARSVGDDNDFTALLFGIVASVTAVISLVLATVQFVHSRRLQSAIHPRHMLVHHVPAALLHALTMDIRSDDPEPAHGLPALSA
jgi:uncharacterized membrane protein